MNTPSDSGSSRFARDLSASLVVFLVALPLSLGIAVASGAPTVRAGLVAAIVGGLVVGLLGGAPLQVSGPAAGLTVMVFGYIQAFGFRATCAIVILAGVIQLAAGALRFARAALAISPAVLQAMLAGIGVLIALGQVHVLFGHRPGGSAGANLANLPASVSNLNTSAALVGFTTLAVLLLWNRFVAARVKFVPGSLVAIASGTILAAFLPGEQPLVAVPENVLAAFEWPSIEGTDLGARLVAAVGLAFVASAESLLCAVATDRLHDGPRAKLNKELAAQGIGNIVSGALGGLPITGVIVRSSANIASGARTSLSATLHGAWMLLFVALCAGFLGRIPMAALAALLVHVGVNLVKIKEFRRVHAFGEAAVYAVTLGGVVFINLLWGIGLGFALALVLMLRRLVRAELEVREREGVLHATLRGHLTFLAVPAITHALDALAPQRTVHLELEVDALDHAAVEAIHDWRVSYERGGGKVTGRTIEERWRELTHDAAGARA
jgi:carbonic anhydrase